MEQITPRFVHIVDDESLIENTKYSGMTIAYIRYDDMVLFGYTLCIKNDQYSKKVGREYALKSLDKSSDLRIESSSIIKIVDTKNRAGFIDLEVFKNTLGLSSILSDQLMKNVSLFDFKHSFISHVLAAVTIEYLVDENW